MSQLWKDFVLAEKIIKPKYVLHLVALLVIILQIICIVNSTLIDWDEGVFALQGQWLTTTGAQGKPFNFQTPPLYQILIALFFEIFGTNALVLPYLSLICSCITIYLIYHLAKTLYSKHAAIYSIIFFVTTEFFLFFSKSGLSEATFLLFFIAALYFFFKAIKFNRTMDFLFAGLLTTFALYTKYSAFPLLAMFLVIGVLNRAEINKRWFLLSIALPAILYLPYIYLFLKFVSLSEITARHGGLLGINHFKFLLYILAFAPIPFFLTIIYKIFDTKITIKRDIYLYICSAIFFIMLGFYYPYFRLAYPLIPILAILASRFILLITSRYRIYIAVALIFVSIILSMNTIVYKSNVPKQISDLAKQYIEEQNIKYVYTVVPPNIDFYIPGTILVPSTHPWLRIGKKLPAFMKEKKIINPDNNELITEEKVLLVHATAFDSLKKDHAALYNSGTLLTSIEFKDAPLYYKDIYNPQRNMKQLYEIYIFESDKITEKINGLWNLGFDRRVHVRYQGV